MPLTLPLPPGNEGITQVIANLEDAIARDDAINVNRYRIDLISALGYAYQYGVFGEGEPVALQIEGIIAAAGAWLQQRVAAGAGGRGVVAVAPAPNALTYEEALVQGTAQVESLVQSQLREIYNTAKAGDGLPGETWRQMVARIYKARSGGTAPAHLLLEFPDTMVPLTPNAATSSLAVASGAGVPDPWEEIVPSDYGALPPPTFPQDPTAPDIDRIGLESPDGPGTAPSGPIGLAADDTDDVGAGADAYDAAAEEGGLGQGDVRRNVALPNSGLATISGKVVAVVALLVLGLWLVTRNKGS